MYTYMFCFLISDDVMLPLRTALFSSLCPYFMKRQKQDPLRASSRRDVTSCEKRSITKSIPSRNFQVTGANYARKLLSTYLVNANNR